MSLIEALANVGVGYGVAVLTQIVVFPLVGLHASLSQNLWLGAAFTILCGAPHKIVYAERIVMRSSIAVLQQLTDTEGIILVECSA